MKGHSVKPEVLGRLLLLPSMLEVLPDTRSLADFLKVALCEIPGIADVIISILGEVYPRDRSIEKEKSPNLTVTTESKKTVKYTLPLETLNHSYGYIIIDAENPELFTIYKPHICNIANIVATLLENRNLIQELQIRKEHLEEQVAERTKELREEILRRQELESKLLEAQYIAKIGNFTWDLDTDIITWSQGMFQILKYDPKETIDYYKVNSTIHHPDDSEKITKWLIDSIASGQETVPPNEYRLICQDGEVIYVEVNITIEYQEEKAVKVFGTCQDITRRKETEKKLELAAKVFTYAREGIFITDSDGKVIQVNHAFTEITGYSSEEVVGKTPSIFNSDFHDSDFYRVLWSTLLEKGYWRGEIWNRHKNGGLSVYLLTLSTLYNFDSKNHNYVALFWDITEQKHYQQHIEHLAHYDALTNLANRVLLGERLRQEISISQRNRQLLAVIYIDLDGFKEINDTHGHQIGDQVLIITANRMKQILRESDTVSRLGGDEFVAVVGELVDIEICLHIINRLLTAINQPIQVNNLQLQVSASIGVTFYPQSEDIDGDQLLRQADQAMYQAKLSGKNRYQIFGTSNETPRFWE